VLYEMATARRAFAGKSRYSVASAILEKDPDPIRSVTPTAPPALERVVNRCLAKDPEDRWQTARDVTVELQWAAEHGSEAPIAAPAKVVVKTTPVSKIAWGIAGVSLLAAVALAAAFFLRPSATVHPIRSFISPPEKVTFAFDGLAGGPVLSADGTRLAFPGVDTSGKEALWVRPLDSLSAQRLEGTEGATFPFWAPDSRQIGFFQDGKLKKIDVTGGPAVALCDLADGRGGTWNRNDVIVVSAGQLKGGLVSIPAAGGTPTSLPVREGNGSAFSNRWPSFLPDGKHFIYLSGDLTATGTSNLGIYVAELGSKDQTFLVQADSEALYAPPGYLLYLRGSTLMAQPFDAGSQKLKGEAFPVAEQVTSPQLFRLGYFTVSQTGLMVYQTGAPASASQFTWFDAMGKPGEAVSSPGIQQEPVLSSDGHRLAYIASESGGKNTDVWILDLARGVRTRFTFGPSLADSPVWSPDGSKIVYAIIEKGKGDLYVKNASGAGNAELLFQSDANKSPDDWSRDGRYILFTALDPQGKTKYDLWALPLFGDRKPFAVVQTEFEEPIGMFSPDVKWVAFESNESGNFEVYLSPFPTGGAKWQVSQGGGVQPIWNRDGKTLYYLAPGGRMMAVNIAEKGAAVEIGTPQQLFQTPMADSDAFGRAYAVAPDAKRFLVEKSGQIATFPLTLVANWTAALKK
jgi:eukaryotic-like serine/threonine-protein kinase